MTTIIETEFGPAMLWHDDRSDPDSPGWVLRYHRRDQQHLDEALAAGELDDATREALEFLAREGIGAGRRLVTREAAELAGRTPAGWRSDASAGRAPAADDRWDARTPWWWETTVLRAVAARPGRGARTDLRGD